jgi:glucose/arabinose dehydrogenase
VSRPGGYSIPPDNPFVGYPGLRPEIYAYGFRNPSGITLTQTGRGYVTDPGTNRSEEINILEKGGNYGWAIKEGTGFTGYSGGTTGGTRLPGTPTDTNQPFVDPIYEYPTGSPGGIKVSPSAILGGAVFPDGSYVSADYGGVILALSKDDRLTEAQRIGPYIRAISGS